MKTPAYHKSLETLHVNCLEPRAYFIPFADEKTAASRERSESDYFVPLCGEWDFRFFKSFEDVLREPPEYVGESGFDKISVPRSWQTYTDRGYDVPLYSNLEYPFPTDPPFVPDENPVTGHAVTLDDMIEDIMLIKRANCNMIRTSHYPNDPRFLALCDKYGIMLTDEADIETHGMGYDWEGEWDWTRWSHLSSAPEWRDAYVDRAKRLFERDKNHGCVVLWSLGNESGAGVNHRAMAQYIRSRDDRALVHYENSHLEFKAVPEGENFADISDVESRMYAGTEYIENYLNNKEYTKPFYMCEYVCSMSTGDVYPFWDLVEKYDNNFGGCIWEWCDHAVNVPDENGNARYFYGGDFGDFPNSSICCIDGLVYPDRTPRPGYFDMKRVYQQYSAAYNGDGSVTVTSRRRFTTLDDMAIHWTLSESGKIVSEGTTAALSTPAQGSTIVKLFDPADFDSLPSCLLTLSFVSTKDTPWAEKGFETGFEQFVLKDYAPYVPKDGRVELSENDRFAVIKAGNIAYTFDKPYGRISSITCGGEELLSAPVEPQIWRAPCYNRGSSEMWRLKNFRYAAQKTYSYLVCETDGGVCIKTKIAIGGPSCPPVIHADVDYKFTPDGCVTLCFDGDVIEKCPILPKVGYRLFMPSENESVSYFGFGPREAYVDRYKSQRLGLWNTTVTDNFEHYIRPQENGAHYGTRFAEVYSNAAGLRFEPFGMEHFSFNAQHFTAQMLEDTKHDFELEPLNDTVVSLDWRMTGISEAEYHNDPERALRRIDEKKLNFGFVIRPFEK